MVTGIEAGFAHRARLAQDLAGSPRNHLRSPPYRPHIQIANRKWELETEPPTTQRTKPTAPNDTEKTPVTNSTVQPN